MLDSGSLARVCFVKFPFWKLSTPIMLFVCAGSQEMTKRVSRSSAEHQIKVCSTESTLPCIHLGVRSFFGET